MKWADLSSETKNVLERCWSVFHDKPCSFTVKLNKPFRTGNEVSLPTEETYVEILIYQKQFPYFNVSRTNDEISVAGNCDYGSWM